MTTRIHPISEINQRAKDVWLKEIGVVDTIRFLNQFRVGNGNGNGNYTAERDSLFKEMTARQIIAALITIPAKPLGGGRLARLAGGTPAPRMTAVAGVMIDAIIAEIKARRSQDHE
ncbi:hypothetical protein [uncultured Thiocystis sp.]|jgi:hypothetical protein|uniref:hypothetical protein n=1 Tax=uncultured Thiocystis sp. TaxID=1202134 RepID=UPI0025EFE8D9|nr:hypothetical protein [uncultured Thiocystis sp.]